MRRFDDVADLGVDQHGGLLAVVLAGRDLLAQEHHVLALAERERTQLVAHTEARDHVARDRAGLFQVTHRARREVFEHHQFGGTTTHAVTQPVLELLLGMVVALFVRRVRRHPQRATARDDRDLGDRIRTRDQPRDQRVASLVIRGRLPLALGHDETAALEPERDLVLGVDEIAERDLLVIATRAQKRGLVHQVREVGAGHAGRLARDQFQVDVLGQRHLARVHLQDALAAAHVGPVDDDLAIEAAGTQQCGVEHVGTVRGRDQDDAFIRLEAIHLDQQLVQRLLALIVAAAKARTTVPPDSVDFIDENYAIVCVATTCDEVVVPIEAQIVHRLARFQRRDRLDACPQDGRVREVAHDLELRGRLDGVRRDPGLHLLDHGLEAGA